MQLKSSNSVLKYSRDGCCLRIKTYAGKRQVSQNIIYCEKLGMRSWNYPEALKNYMSDQICVWWSAKFNLNKRRLYYFFAWERKKSNVKQGLRKHKLQLFKMLHLACRWTVQHGCSTVKRPSTWQHWSVCYCWLEIKQKKVEKSLLVRENPRKSPSESSEATNDWFSFYVLVLL